MRFVIYARKSTESEDRQVQSLDDQLRALHEIAEREGHLVTQVFQESKSAKVPGNRPEFDRMIQEIEDGGIDGVLTWAINRLSRNPVDGGRIAYLLQTGRLSMIRTKERTYLPDDNALLLSIENGMATAFIQDLSRNVKRGMQGKFERGWHTGKAPLGYKNDPESREIVPDPERFDVVKRAWSMLLSGQHDLAEAVEFMRDTGLSVSSRRRNWGVASEALLYSIFHRPFYCGRIQLNGVERQGKHLPMVTEDEFERVQGWLAMSHHRRKTKRPENAFRGLLRCSSCGCVVVADKKTKTYPRTSRTVEYLYYHCSGAKGCSKESIRHSDLLDSLAKQANQVSISDRFAQWVRQSCAAIIESSFNSQPGPDASIKAIEVEQSRLDALVAMRAGGEIGLDEFARGRQRILDQISELRSQQVLVVSKPIQVLNKLDNLLTASVAGRSVTSTACKRVAEFVRQVGGALFQPGTVQIAIHPALQKIAALEPLVCGSETAISGTCLVGFKEWYSELEEIISLIADSDMQ